MGKYKQVTAISAVNMLDIFYIIAYNGLNR